MLHNAAPAAFMGLPSRNEFSNEGILIKPINFTGGEFPVEQMKVKEVAIPL